MYMPYVRYKFESNSQHLKLGDEAEVGCICHMLDTSLKAIHNATAIGVVRSMDVYAIC